MKIRQNDLVSVLSLFTSVSTLLCCALPALLVVLGLGVVVAGIISDVPFLITLSQNKEWVFAFAFLTMGLNFYLLYFRKKKQVSCEYIPGKTETACDVASRWSKVILWISFTLLVIGFFVSYFLIPILRSFE